MKDKELLESISYLIEEYLEEYLDEYVNRELLESISYLIDEDLDEYVKRAPVHNGKKVLSERAWDALYEREFSEYINKHSFTPEEHKYLSDATREFGEKYECSF